MFSDVDHIPRIIKFRTPLFLTMFWFFAAATCLCICLVVKPYLPMPQWVEYLAFAAGIAVIVHAFAMPFANVWISDNGMGGRHFVSWKINFSDVQKWSQWSENGSIFVLEKNGRVRSFSSWVVYGSRSSVLSQALKERLGPPAVGDQAVMPFMLRIISR